MKKIAETMSSCTGVVIDEKSIVKIPNNFCTLITLDYYDVYAARTPNSTVLAYAYPDGRITIHII